MHLLIPIFRAPIYIVGGSIPEGRYTLKAVKASKEAKPEGPSSVLKTVKANREARIELLLKNC